MIDIDLWWRPRRAEPAAQLAVREVLLAYALEYLIHNRGQLTLAELWFLVFAHERRAVPGRETMEG